MTSPLEVLTSALDKRGYGILQTDGHSMHFLYRFHVYVIYADPDEEDYFTLYINLPESASRDFVAATELHEILNYINGRHKLAKASHTEEGFVMFTSDFIAADSKALTRMFWRCLDALEAAVAYFEDRLEDAIEESHNLPF